MPPRNMLIVRGTIHFSLFTGEACLAPTYYSLFTFRFDKLTRYSLHSSLFTLSLFTLHSFTLHSSLFTLSLFHSSLFHSSLFHSSLFTLSLFTLSLFTLHSFTLHSFTLHFARRAQNVLLHS